jgi:hypothetical protein
MTLLAFAEQLRGAIQADAVEEQERRHQRVVYRARVGKQTFVVTFEEDAPDREEPAIT